MKILPILKKIFYSPKEEPSLLIPDINYTKIQDKLNYYFNNLDLLVIALTHDSVLHDVNFPRNGAVYEQQSYERLEFLGDSVLGLVVSEYLYHTYPYEDEGYLSKLKASLVSEKFLALKAGEFDLGNYITMSDKEERNGGKERKSIISDAMEALIGAIFLDGGFARARRLIHDFILKDCEEHLLTNDLTNYKSILQEYCQSLYQNTPEYKQINESGPDHRKLFTMEVYVNAEKCGCGFGPNKKEAQQQAAQDACKKFNLL